MLQTLRTHLQPQRYIAIFYIHRGGWTEEAQQEEDSHISIRKDGQFSTLCSRQRFKPLVGDSCRSGRMQSTSSRLKSRWTFKVVYRLLEFCLTVGQELFEEGIPATPPPFSTDCRQVNNVSCSLQCSMLSTILLIEQISTSHRSAPMSFLLHTDAKQCWLQVQDIVRQNVPDRICDICKQSIPM